MRASTFASKRLLSNLVHGKVDLTLILLRFASLRSRPPLVLWTSTSYIPAGITGIILHELLGVDGLYPTGGLVSGAAPPTIF